MKILSWEETELLAAVAAMAASVAAVAMILV